MRARLAMVPLVAAAALLFGCGTSPGTTTTSTPTNNGVEALSADEILTKAKAALIAAKSFHVKGNLSEGGQAVAVDFKVSGSDLSGTTQTNGANFEIIKIGNDLYVKAPDEFWAALTPSGKLAQFAALKGKYAKADTTFAAFATISGAFTPEALLKPEGTTSKGGTKTIGGIPAIGVVDSKDKSVVYIATRGEPLPLAFDSADGKSEALVTEHGQAMDIKAPAATDVVDVKPLMNG
jgi:hypothetical protein